MTVSMTAETEAVIVIPTMPPREVSPNWHGSWRKRAAAAAAFRAEAGWATRFDLPAAFLGRVAPVAIDVEIAWCCGRRRLDDDNALASCKAALDGIADVLWDGQDRHVTVGTVTQTRGQGTVTVTLRGAP